MNDDNGGLGTKVLRVKRSPIVGDPEDDANWAEVLVDGDYDGEWFESIAKYMRVIRNGYVNITPHIGLGGGNTYLHHLVAKPPKGYWVHFKNKNPLDCRTSNLEVLTPKEVMKYRKPVDYTLKRQSTGWSQYKGVSRYNDIYRVRLRGEEVGTFTDEVEAAKAYDRASYAFWGDRFRVNFPDDFPRKDEEGHIFVNRQRPKYERKTDDGQCPRCGVVKRLDKEVGICSQCIKERSEQ